MKFDIKRSKSATGRIVAHVAYLPGTDRIELGRGETPADARAFAEQNVAAAIRRFDRGANSGTWRGGTWLVVPTLEGWASGWCEKGGLPRLSCQGAYDSREECENRCLFALAQQLWTKDVKDAEFVEGLPVSIHAEFDRWAQWQRHYSSLVEEGRCANCAHTNAGRDRAYFTAPCRDCKSTRVVS